MMRVLGNFLKHAILLKYSQQDQHLNLNVINFCYILTSYTNTEIQISGNNLMLKLKNLGLPLILALGCLNSTAFATPAKSSSVEQLMQLTHVNQTLQDSTQAMQPVFEQQSVQIIQKYTGHQTLTAQDLTASKQMTAVFKNMTADLLKKTNTEEMIRKLYQQNFSEEEVQAYIRFLNTPEGRSIEQKTPVLMKQIGLEMAKITQHGLLSESEQNKYKQQIQNILLSLPSKEKISTASKK